MSNKPSRYFPPAGLNIRQVKAVANSNVSRVYKTRNVVMLIVGAVLIALGYSYYGVSAILGGIGVGIGLLILVFMILDQDKKQKRETEKLIKEWRYK